MRCHLGILLVLEVAFGHKRYSLVAQCSVMLCGFEPVAPPHPSRPTIIECLKGYLV